MRMKRNARVYVVHEVNRTYIRTAYTVVERIARFQ